MKRSVLMCLGRHPDHHQYGGRGNKPGHKSEPPQPAAVGLEPSRLPECDHFFPAIGTLREMRLDHVPLLPGKDTIQIPRRLFRREMRFDRFAICHTSVRRFKGFIGD
jgi:hypothetical protein